MQGAHGKHQPERPAGAAEQRGLALQDKALPRCWEGEEGRSAAVAAVCRCAAIPGAEQVPAESRSRAVAVNSQSKASGLVWFLFQQRSSKPEGFVWLRGFEFVAAGT